MTGPITEFCETIREKFTTIESGLGDLLVRISCDGEHAEHEVQRYLQSLSHCTKLNKEQLDHSLALIRNLREEHEALTAAEIMEWKTKRATKRLRERAEKAEYYAVAVTGIAGVALENARQAALLAWLARHDADSAVSRPTLRVIDGKKQARPGRDGNLTS
jgi:hypothetical protein